MTVFNLPFIPPITYNLSEGAYFYNAFLLSRNNKRTTNAFDSIELTKVHAVFIWIFLNNLRANVIYAEYLSVTE